MAAKKSDGYTGQTADAFTGGKLFDTVFSRGMALVEETASYLDGPGRDHAKSLDREPGLTYAVFFVVVCVCAWKTRAGILVLAFWTENEPEREK